MNRNSESHFANTPTVNINRSKFDRSFDHKTTFNTGDLIPIFADGTIMPGDTVNMKMAQVVRMMTPIAPVMDNANIDIYFFYVPYRLIWEHWKQFMGENDTAPWTQTVEYEIPQIVAPENGWKKGSLADYMGYPTKVGNYKASALPFRAYALIWNEWFRDQNLKNPCNITLGDSDITGTDKTTLGATYDYVIDTEKGAAPCKAAKYFDYFTSCLPEPQKGPAVNIPLGDKAPIVGEEPINLPAGHTLFSNAIDKELNFVTESAVAGQIWTDEETPSTMSTNMTIKLVTDLSNAVGATVNQLRQAFAIQKFYERQAIGGTRYIEMIKSHFDVTNPDFRMQRPEYLGGKRIPINMNQVVQTDASGKQLVPEYADPDNPAAADLVWTESAKTPQGNTAAYSVTSDSDDSLFTHSFTEHGILMGLAVVRTVHTYQQGLNAQWSKKKFTDFYFPEFANLGNMPVYNKEIFIQGTSDDDEAFGYQEAWASERYFPNRVSGEMRSNYDLSLDIWHYGDDYESLPSLSSDWIDETEENMARTLAVQDQDQFFGDFYFGAVYTRPMPLYSVPGLIDHH